MTFITNGKINDLVVNCDYDLQKSVVDLLQPEQTLARSIFTVKEEFWDDDNDAIIQIEITSTEVINKGKIIPIDEDNENIQLLFTIAPEDTIKLSPYFKYIYDIKLITDDDQNYLLELGELIPLPSVTEQE